MADETQAAPQASAPAPQAAAPATAETTQPSLENPAMSDYALDQAAIAAFKAAGKPLVSGGEAPADPAAAAALDAPAVAPAAAVAPPAQQATPPAAAPEPDPLAARVAAFAAEQAKTFQAKQEAERAAREAAEAKAAVERELAELRAKLKSKPLEALQAEGWALDALNRHAVSGRTPESVEVARVSSDVQALRAELAAERQRVAQEAAALQQRTFETQMVNDVIPRALASLGAADQDPAKNKVPTLSAFYTPQELHGLVFQLMRGEAARAQAHPGEGITVPTPSEAATRLEAELSARVKRTQPAVTGTATQPEVKPAAKPVPGITNSTTSATHTPLPASTDISDEALNAAARAFMRTKPLIKPSAA